jgi:hypothetical protein
MNGQWMDFDEKKENDCENASWRRLAMTTAMLGLDGRKLGIATITRTHTRFSLFHLLLLLI